MFTAIGVMKVKASTTNLERKEVVDKLKNVCYLTTIMDMIAGIGTVLTICLINRSSNLPPLTVRAVVGVGIFEFLIGFFLFNLSGNIK